MSGVRAKREKRPLLRRRRCVLRPLARVGRRRCPGHPLWLDEWAGLLLVITNNRHYSPSFSVCQPFFRSFPAASQPFSCACMFASTFVFSRENSSTPDRAEPTAVEIKNGTM